MMVKHSGHQVSVQAHRGLPDGEIKLCQMVSVVNALGNSQSWCPRPQQTRFAANALGSSQFQLGPHAALAGWKPHCRGKRCRVEIPHCHGKRSDMDTEHGPRAVPEREQDSAIPRGIKEASLLSSSHR